MANPSQAQGVLPFVVSEDQVRGQLPEWFHKQALTPSGFSTHASLTSVSRAYLPCWLARARVFCPWHAQSGTYIGERSMAEGRRSRAATWELATGVVEHVFDDVLVPASRAIQPDLIAAIEPWPTEELKPIEDRPIEDTILELEQVATDEVARRARQVIAPRIRQLCLHEIPGDTHRFLVVSPEYSEESARVVLMPVWMVSYTFRGQTFRMVANGCTGKLAGTSPTSRWKFLLITLLVLAIVGGTVAGVWTIIQAAR